MHATGIHWDEKPLGCIPDRELARQLGVRNTSVSRARRRRDIPKWEPNHACPQCMGTTVPKASADPVTLRSVRPYIPPQVEEPEPYSYPRTPPTPLPRRVTEPQQVTQGLRRILFVPDTHRPYHDRQAWAVMVRAARAFKPHIIVVLGDFADFYSVSSHDRDPRRVSLLEQEICDVCDGLDELESLGAERLIYCEGNHEWRLARYLMKKAPELFGLVEVDQLLGLERRGWEWIPYRRSIQVGKIWCTHDLGKAGKYAAMQAITDAGASVVIGHLHRMCTFYAGSVFGEHRVAACFGWLGSEEACDYRHRIRALREYRHGFGVGYMEPDGTVHLQAVPIIHGRCVVGGTLVQNPYHVGNDWSATGCAS